MTEEFNLSEKIGNVSYNEHDDGLDLRVEDVKEFIIRLKEEFEKWGSELQELQMIERDKAIAGRLECPACRREFKEIIDKLAGENLV